MKRWPLLAAALPWMASCGGSIEGVYSGAGTGFLDQIEILDDERVEVKFMGTIREGTYEIRNDTIRINVRGDVSELRIGDDGCLEGEGILGRYCKTGASGSGSAKVSSAGAVGSGDSLVGGRFAAGPRGDQIVLEFIDGRTVRVEVDGEADSVPYENRGGRIVIHGADGTDLELVSRGRDLEGGPDGMVLVFRRI